MENLDFLINYLIEENKEVKVENIPEDMISKKRLYRSLCNIRDVKPISEEYLKIENEYLQEELKNKVITEVKDIEALGKEFPKSKICLWKGDITTLKIEAIVNAANSGGVGCFIPCHNCIDNIINSTSGVSLRLECGKVMEKIGVLETGKAFITKGYNLPSEYVIHTVGPRWRLGLHGEREQLVSCYRTSLLLAKEKGCQSVAFPLISSGIYGYPKDKALRVAIDTIGEFLLHNDMMVYLVIFDRNAYHISRKLSAKIDSYIDDRYVEKHTDLYAERMQRAAEYEEAVPAQAQAAPQAPGFSMPVTGKSLSLEEAISQMDESFSEMLLRKIDEKGMTDAQCYKKANIDRKLFSKIRGDKLYKPSKPTAIAFAVALELTLDETKDMLMKAGFSLSHSNKFDIIIEYFIERGNYNVFEINEALFAFDQSLLGA